MTDQEAIRAIQDGNKGVFQQVFDTCYESLCEYAFTILKDIDEAEDIVQSMFIKLWEKRESLDIKYTIKSYLFKAVYHQCINSLAYRTVRIKYNAFGQLNMRHEVQQPEVFPDELEESIRSAINGLPQQCRIIFVLSRYEELRYSEIAKKMNISINTVENQISKALKILRSELKDIIG